LGAERRFIIKLKPIEPIIIVFCHPANLTSKRNIIASHVTNDHVYNEPSSMGICKMYKEAHSP
jgi:hypothetical protein